MYRCFINQLFYLINSIDIVSQVSSGCSSSPCTFGCSPMGNAGFSCGCPGGYQRIAQVLILHYSNIRHF